MREWSQIASEPERLEILLHELGHFLGAVHSPERDSVMRVLLVDKKARARTFQIHFDPLNALAMCLVSDELRRQPANRLAEMRLETQLELYKLYLEIVKTLPDDPAAKIYLGLIDRTRVAPLMAGSQLVLRAIVAAAEENAAAPVEASPSQADEADAVSGAGPANHRLDGDRLGEFYVRRGAPSRQAAPCRDRLASILDRPGDSGRPERPTPQQPAGRGSLRAGWNRMPPGDIDWRC